MRSYSSVPHSNNHVVTAWNMPRCDSGWPDVSWVLTTTHFFVTASCNLMDKNTQNGRTSWHMCLEREVWGHGTRWCWVVWHIAALWTQCLLARCHGMGRGVYAPLRRTYAVLRGACELSHDASRRHIMPMQPGVYIVLEACGNHLQQ